MKSYHVRFILTWSETTSTEVKATSVFSALLLARSKLDVEFNTLIGFEVREKISEEVSELKEVINPSDFQD